MQRVMFLGSVLLFASTLQARDPAFLPREIEAAIDDPNVFSMPIGRARSGATVAAVLHREDLEPTTAKTRILLIGDSSWASRSVGADMVAFYSQPDVNKRRERYVVSAVPRIVPLISSGRLESIDPVYPPPGTAYHGLDLPETMYLWRWIGMHAPDLVVHVSTGKTTRWFVPDDFGPQRKPLAKILRAVDKSENAELVTALTKFAACETGTIPALHIETNGDGVAAYLFELLIALDSVGFCGPTAARRELQKRLDRSPLSVARQLSQHYGHDLNQVVYIPALALVGRLRLGELTDEATHAEDVRRIVAPYVHGDRRADLNSGSALSGHLIFAELAQRSKGAERERYLALARSAAELAFSDDGQPQPCMPFHNEMSDAFFMGGPILAHVGKLTGEEKCFDACIRHLRFMRKLVLRSDGLYRHSPLDEAAWGRGNGFPALGLAWCLSCWPEDREDRAELLKMFRDHMSALASYQDASGCWHQVIDHPESYRELSCTSMITFALARGVRMGWLDRERYGQAIERGWQAVRLRVKSDGHLVDVCTGTGKQKTLDDYFARPAILGPDARGGAMALLAATEMAMYAAAP